MNTRRLIMLLLGGMLVSGCANTVIPTFSNSPDYSTLYLRGVFSWWEADEKYKLKEVDEDVFATRIELIADGQPYDFKFADAKWSADLNCGYLSIDDQVVELNSVVKASCDRANENFKFTPSETGLYEFTIDFSGFGSPRVHIALISS